MSSYSVRKPITVLMGILIVIVLGVFSLTRLPLTLFPEVNLPFVVTITTYEGKTPEEVEVEVSKRIESAVSTIGNFKEVSSRSNENFAISIITFAESSNMDSIIVELRELLNNTRFAEGVGSTRILRISPDMLPVMTVTLFREYDDVLTDEEILIRNTEWINKDLQILLQSIPGVADISLTGEADVVLQVLLDPEQLSAFGITHQEVLDIIESQNVGGLIGVALDNGELRMLYLGDRISRMADIEALPILTHQGSVISLSDLILPNGLNYINASTNTYSKINGVLGIQVSFQKQSDYAITTVVDHIMDRLDEIIENDPNASYTVLLNQGEYIQSSINSVLSNILIGGVLAILILFFFLKDIKPTLIVGLAIPISVIATFVFMYFANISLNIISMGGLALAIGMLVDNSIVVIENIYRMIHEGKTKIEAAIEGSKQVASAITASTITTAAVFLPILFIEGLVADVFMAMAYTIAFALGSSLLIALTMVPSMASKMLDDAKPKKEGAILSKTKFFYAKAIRFTLKRKYRTLLLVVGLLLVSAVLVIEKGFIFLPSSDEGTIRVSIETNRFVSFDSKAQFSDQLTEDIMQLDDVDTISITIGGGGFMGFGGMANTGNVISMTINLKDNRQLSTQEVALKIQDLIESFDYTRFDDFAFEDINEWSVSSQDSTSGFGQQSGIVIKVSGYNLLTMETIANQIVSIISEVEGVVKPDNGVNQGADNVKITVDKNQAMLHGLTTADVQKQVGYLFYGLQTLGAQNQTTMTIDGVRYGLDIPQGNTIGSISFDAFGDYLTFLSGIMLFDAQTAKRVDDYMASSNQGIYVLNIMLPNYVEGTPIQFVLNPGLEIVDEAIVFNPMVFLGMMPAGPNALSKQVVAPLYSSDSDQSVATIEKITGFATILTDGSSRYFNVTAQVERGYNVTLVTQEVNRLVDQYLSSETFQAYGSGYSVTYQGENEDIMQAISELSLAAIVAILLVYMVMAIQFQSLIYPLIILGTIPLAFTGGMLALWVVDAHLSIVAVMGLIILIGVVVNNGIVLIDYINKLREQGVPIVDAIIEAGQTRLRPILMTALTTILALLTLALGFGEGSELLQPMAITSIGGLIYGTLLTLIVVPTLYALFNRKAIKKESSSV